MKKYLNFTGLSLLFLSTHIYAREIQIECERLWAKPHEEIQLQIEGGLLPLTWQTTTGQIKRKEKTGREFIYTAPQRYMQDKIKFTDNAGQEAIVYIDILRPLMLSPSQRIIPIKSSTEFKVYGGSGEWRINEVEGINAEKLDEQKFKVTVEKQAGEFILQLKDTKTQDILDVSIMVYEKLKIKN